MQTVHSVASELSAPGSQEWRGQGSIHILGRQRLQSPELFSFLILSLAHPNSFNVMPTQGFTLIFLIYKM